MHPNRRLTSDTSGGRDQAPRVTTTSASTCSVRLPQILQPSGVCTPGAASATLPVEKKVFGELTMCSRFGCSTIGAVELLIGVNVRHWNEVRRLFRVLCSNDGHWRRCGCDHPTRGRGDHQPCPAVRQGLAVVRVGRGAGGTRGDLLDQVVTVP